MKPNLPGRIRRHTGPGVEGPTLEESKALGWGLCSAKFRAQAVKSVLAEALFVLEGPTRTGEFSRVVVARLAANGWKIDRRVVGHTHSVALALCAIAPYHPQCRSAGPALIKRKDGHVIRGNRWEWWPAGKTIPAEKYMDVL